MIGLLVIATTLLMRGVTNMQETALLFAAPQVAVANYTYYYLEKTGLNYTEVMEYLPTLPESFFDKNFWVSPTTMDSMRNTKDYLVKEVPARITEIPKNLYERFSPSKPLETNSNMDIGMVFVGMYLTSLFTLAVAIWLLMPSTRLTDVEIDSDHILMRKRKRTPQRYYDEDRMLLRSMTTEDDTFYALE